jgi:hypothetical protein
MVLEISLPLLRLHPLVVVMVLEISLPLLRHRLPGNGLTTYI